MQVKQPDYTVYYDGACQLCSAEMKNLRRRDVEHRIAFVDAAVAARPTAAAPFEAPPCRFC